MRVLVIGDVIDDIIVVPESEIRKDTDTVAKISQTLGGSAGNIASWASYAGADVTFIGCVHNKDIDRVEKQFAAYGVKVALQRSDKETGKLVSIVEGTARTMLTDRGANRDLDLESITDHYLSQFNFVFLSGYSILDNQPDAVSKFLARASGLGLTSAVDPGSAGFIKDYGIANFKSAINHVDILIPNEDEYDLLGAESKITIVKRGNKSVDYFDSGQLVESFEVLAVDVIDPTGAGDAFSGTVIAKLALGENIRHAITAAMENSALAVRTIGARPEL